MHPALKTIRSPFRRSGSCVLYHRVLQAGTYDLGFNPFPGLIVDSKSFEDQIRYYSENFECLSLEEACQRHSNKTLQPNSLLVTFDDGYRDNLTVALPILEKYQVPATIFVTTGLVDRIAELWWYEQEFFVSLLSEISISWHGEKKTWKSETLEEKRDALLGLNRLVKTASPVDQHDLMDQLRKLGTKDDPNLKYSYDHLMMDWDEVVAISKHPLITIGSHTEQHYVLTLLEEEQVKQEIHNAKQILESRLNQKVQCFSYPFGGSYHVNQREIDEAVRAGYLCACTTSYGHIRGTDKSELFRIPRIGIDYFDTLELISWKLSGLDVFFRLNRELRLE